MKAKWNNAYAHIANANIAQDVRTAFHQLARARDRLETEVEDLKNQIQNLKKDETQFYSSLV